jgi:hypothetical protein
MEWINEKNIPGLSTSLNKVKRWGFIAQRIMNWLHLTGFSEKGLWIMKNWKVR